MELHIIDTICILHVLIEHGVFSCGCVYDFIREQIKVLDL